jgi:hypothetical protein
VLKVKFAINPRGVSTMIRILWLVPFVLGLASTGCEPVAAVGTPTGSYEPAPPRAPVSSTYKGEQLPDDSLNYYNRLTFVPSNWLSDIIAAHRRQFGFVKLQVDPIFLDVKQSPDGRELARKGDAALRGALQAGLSRAKIIDARFRHDPLLTGPAPEIEASWVVFDQLGVLRP